MTIKEGACHLMETSESPSKAGCAVYLCSCYIVWPWLVEQSWREVVTDLQSCPVWYRQRHKRIMTQCVTKSAACNTCQMCVKGWDGTDVNQKVPLKTKLRNMILTSIVWWDCI